jgi:sensor histidine kinase YesM
MIYVPSFILQPFCENAIWHGLLHKDGKGRLSIRFSMKQDVLICTIQDNGIGRERAAGYKSAPVEKVASFGNRLSSERLALFNDDLSGASFVTEDIRNSEGEVTGTSVILRIKNKQVHD